MVASINGRVSTADRWTQLRSSNFKLYNLSHHSTTRQTEAYLMKRSAAIIGPTPPFLRWTIVLPCAFRDPEAKNPANAAFRELRSLRAISVGEIENRIVDGVCVHPDAATVEIENAKGFPVEEVYAAYGGKEVVNSTCLKCPANIGVSGREIDAEISLTKAGCFGWVPFGDSQIDSPGFMRLMECGDPASKPASLVQEFETAFAAVQKLHSEKKMEDLFPETSPAWYGVWSLGTFSHSELTVLCQICESVKSDSMAWRRLASAVRVCRDDPELGLQVDLMSAGDSDGKLWRIEPSCSACGCSNPDTPCQVCGSSATPLRERKTKVLGLRPYLNLVSIVGEPKARTLIAKAVDRESV